METRQTFIKGLRALSILGVICCGLISIIGSATPPPPPPPEDLVEPLTYDFSFTHPGEGTEKHNITIGIVSPQWQEGSFSYDTAFAVKTHEKLMEPDLMATRGPIPDELAQILTEFSQASGNEFTSMMVNRGFDTMGPFDTIDDMTDPQKKDCELVLFPEFKLHISAQEQEMAVGQAVGMATLKGEIILSILEPLSKEKLWMKKVNTISEPFPFKYIFTYKALRREEKYDTLLFGYKRTGTKLVLYGYERTGIKWDNRTQRTAAALTVYFSEILDKAWKYFSPEELKVLKKRSDEIRERKML